MSNRLTLTDILHFPNPDDVKIKLARHDGNPEHPALDAMMADDEIWRNINCYKGKPRDANNNMGDRGLLATFAQYYPCGPEYYMFGGLYELTDTMPGEYDCIAYDWRPVPMYEKYKNRLIIRLDQKLRQGHMWNYSGFLSSIPHEVWALLPPEETVYVDNEKHETWALLTTPPEGREPLHGSAD